MINLLCNSKIQQLTTPMIYEENSIQKLVPLIKIIKERESIYFEALGFANKNIESSSNDFDQIYIFSKFLTAAAETQAELVKIQDQFLVDLGPNEELSLQSLKINNNSKQMMRLYARSLELIEEAVERARKSLFGDNGKLGIDFTRFKKSLHKIVKQNPIDIHDFAEVFINFSKTKYRKQIGRLKIYLTRLQDGDHVSFRDMFAAKQGSDASSPQQKIKFKSTGKAKRTIKQQTSETQSPHKRPSTRKNSQPGSKTKRNLNLTKSKRQDSIMGQRHTKQRKSEKSSTAAQLLKFYHMMELNKKQFLEDYIFEKQAEQQQRKRLMTILMQKNKFNDEQIKQYYHKCQKYNPSIHAIANPSSDQNQTSLTHRNQSSVGSRMSLKTSFIISKRKPSFTFQSPSDRSQAQLSKNQLPFSKTIKNLSTRKRPGNTTSRPKQSSRSKKIFVVKSPMVFEDDMIPKAEVTTTQWIQTPLGGGGKQRSNSRRNQNIRLKKRNNPCPLDNNFLPESFHFTQYPI